MAENGQTTDRGVDLKLPLTQEEIGQMIGVSRETVSRLLAEFEEQGILELEGSRVRILKGHQLDDLPAIKCRKAAKENAVSESMNSPAAGQHSSSEARPGPDRAQENPRRPDFLN